MLHAVILKNVLVQEPGEMESAHGWTPQGGVEVRGVKPGDVEFSLRSPGLQITCHENQRPTADFFMDIHLIYHDYYANEATSRDSRNSSNQRKWRLKCIDCT